jgi:nitrogen fixation/metabolism regulation signal transduction histidine kinase
MKRKIIIALALFCLIFLTSGFAVIRTLEQSDADLNNLLLLHQVELVREQLLLELKRTQLDLQLKNTRHARGVEGIFTHVSAMDKVIRSCFECHHTASVFTRLDALQASIEHYKDALSRVLTIRANARQLIDAQDRAYRLGEDIVAEVTNITDLSSRKLQAHTRRALKEGRQTKAIVYAILLVTPFLALGLSVLFIRGFTRPVQTLIMATRRLQKGDLDYRIEGLKDEYGEVASSFNQMAISLKEHLERMQWAEQAVVLGELAGGLAHEIKNPLAGVKASVDILAMDPTTTPENRDVLIKVAEQVKRMEALIKSFMSFARPPRPQFEVTDMHTVIDSTVSLMQRHPLLSRGRPVKITIEKEYDPRMPTLTADPTQLQQVFLNLLLNAAEAMEQGGGTITVTTSYDPEAGAIDVRVHDNGKGVDEKIRDKIFQPFFTTKAKGTGLGLSITKRLVEQQGGSIRYEFSEGGGGQFIMTFPIAMSVEVPVS